MTTLGPMSDDLQRGAPIGVEWKPVEEEKPVQTITVEVQKRNGWEPF
jgi:hypothetical protein